MAAAAMAAAAVAVVVAIGLDGKGLFMQTLTGSCHCGAVRLTLPSSPRDGHQLQLLAVPARERLWAYYEFGSVQVSGHPEHTEATSRATAPCRPCAAATAVCVTH